MIMSSRPGCIPKVIPLEPGIGPSSEAHRPRRRQARSPLEQDPALLDRRRLPHAHAEARPRATRKPTPRHVGDIRSPCLPIPRPHSGSTTLRHHATRQSTPLLTILSAQLKTRVKPILPNLRVPPIFATIGRTGRVACNRQPVRALQSSNPGHKPARSSRSIYAYVISRSRCSILAA